MLPPLILSGLISFIANLAIGAFVYLRNPRNATNRYFALFSLTVSGWSVGSFLVNVIPDRALAVAVVRGNYLFGIWLLPVFLHLHYSFAPLTPARRKKLLASYVMASLLSLTDLTPIFVADLRLLQTTPYPFRITQPGPAYYAFFGAFGLTVTEVLWALFQELRATAGPRRVQFRFLMAGTIIAVLAGMEYFSRVFGWLKSPPLDDYILVAYLLVIAYAIVRHKLFDVEVVVRRTVVFAGLSLVVWLVIGVISFWLPTQLLALFGLKVPAVWLNTLSVVIIVRLFERVKKRLIELTNRYLFQKTYDYKQLLKQLSEQVMTLVDLRELVQMTVSTLSGTMSLDGCGLWLRDPDAGMMTLMASSGGLDAERTLDASGPLPSALRTTQSPLGLDAVTGRAPIPPEAGAALQRLKARLAVPLLLHDELIGVLALGKKKSDEPFSQEDLEVLGPLGTTVAIAVGNARLFTELAKTQAEAEAHEVRANTDALTGLLVRRAFTERAVAALAQAQRLQQPCGLLMIDLDHFKETNDGYGHLAGDAVLQDIATRLLSVLRQGDLLGRFGGEEFVILLPGSTAEASLDIAERLRERVASTPVKTSEIMLTQTLSIGLAAYPHDGETLDALIERADQALYAAKRGGRNRTVRA